MKVWVFVAGYEGIIQSVSVFDNEDAADKAYSEWLGEDKEEFDGLLESENAYMEEHEPTNIYVCEVESSVKGNA